MNSWGVNYTIVRKLFQMDLAWGIEKVLHAHFMWLWSTNIHAIMWVHKKTISWILIKQVVIYLRIQLLYMLCSFLKKPPKSLNIPFGVCVTVFLLFVLTCDCCNMYNVPVTVFLLEYKCTHYFHPHANSQFVLCTIHLLARKLWYPL